MESSPAQYPFPMRKEEVGGGAGRLGGGTGSGEGRAWRRVAGRGVDGTSKPHSMREDEEEEEVARRKRIVRAAEGWRWSLSPPRIDKSFRPIIGQFTWVVVQPKICITDLKFQLKKLLLLFL